MWNSITIVGNLGRDPELKYTPQGTPICQFTMASNDRKKEKGEWVQVATWFRITCFGRQAETCAEYLVKGKACLVLGRLRADDWTDRDGKARYTLEVMADRVQFLGKRDDREDREQFDHDSNKGSGPDNSIPPDDDVPF